MAEEENQVDEELSVEEQAKQEQAELTKRENILIKFFKKQLENIEGRLLRSKSTKLSFVDQGFIKQSKKYPELKKNIKRINDIITVNKMKKRMKTLTTSTAGSGGLMILAIIVAVVLIMAIIISLIPKWLLEDILGIKIDDEELNNVGNEFGISCKDFYGARVIYKDDEKATETIIENYVDLVETNILEAQTITKITNKDGDVLDISVEINITLPEEDYTFNEFDETQFSTDYNSLYLIVLDMAKIVYKADNATDYAGTNLVECVNGIKYFGYGESITEISTLVKKEIVDNLTYNVTYPETEGGETVTPVEKTEVDALITTKLDGLYANENYKQRTEKLFVKDVILENNDDYVSGLVKEHYTAFIFMPKKDVVFNSLSFTVGGKLTDFNVKLTNNGTEINLKNDGSNMGNDKNDLFMYYSDKNVNQNVSTFTDIDTNNLNALSGGVSLFDIVNNTELDYSIYLESNADSSALTVKKNGLVAELSNSEEFLFVERETTWKAAS